MAMHTIRLFLIILISIPLSVYAQETSIVSPDLQAYRKGLELFDKEKFAAAQQQFEMSLEQLDRDETELRANARYYIAICAIELYHEDAEHLLDQFISQYPENPKVNSAYFYMGTFQYRQKKYHQTIHWFNKINRKKLNKEELGEYHFKLGYSYYQRDKLTEASKAFFEIKDGNATYASPALYYYSQIAYQKSNYQTALEGFQQLTQNNTFSPIMPYYITQIYYLQEKYEQVIDYAPQFVQSASAKRLPEIAKIIGDSYYQLQQYDSALTYLKMHQVKGGQMNRQDYYQLGYVAYQLDSLDKAIQNFEKITNKEDTLAQNAYYHLADCYLKQDKRNNARLAFEFAANLHYDPQIRESALFNFAKITYQMRNTPFNAAIKAFKEYINAYPDSENTPQAYNYLVKAYLNSNNYKDALQSLDELDKLEVPLRKAYQKVAFFRGLELYNNRHYQEAIQTFNKSIKYNDYNQRIAALCKYWSGEAHYQLQHYEKATASYNRFLLSPGAYNTEVYERAHYNLGYACFKLEDHPQAIKWFRKYANLSRSEKNKYLVDTYNRIGDSYFIRRKYWQAIDYYDNALQLDLRSQDYALYQRGFALGLLNRPEKKIATLKRLIDHYPESGYLDDAHFEIGKSYMNLDQQENALNYFTRITEDFPSSNYVKESLVQLGLIHYNLNNNQKAISYYKRVLTEYPGTEQGRNALTGLKNIYVDMNRVGEYFSYINSLGDYGRVSTNEQDSLTYISAEKAYMNEGCDNAIDHFQQYLEKFRNGNFTVNAHFYMADCFNRQNSEEKALDHYQYVINQPQNSFTEQALSEAARINMNMKNHHQALDHLKKLEKVAEVKRNLIFSRTGQMRAHYFLEQYQKAYEAADKVLHTEKVNDREKREAHFMKAKALFFEEKYDMALKEFRIVSAKEVNSSEGAEAKYRTAQIYYQQKQYKVAENEIFDFLQQNSSQEYWKAKSFILLADVYLAMQDTFQAKHTLKSIIENYKPEDKNDGILQTAKNKYNTIVEQEKYQMENDTLEEKLKIRLKEQQDDDTSLEIQNKREQLRDSTIKYSE